MESFGLQPNIARRYDLIELLGQGRMGVVYRAFDRLTGMDVALKQVRRPGRGRVRLGTPLDSDVQQALAQEFMVLSTLRHPNIVSVVDYGFAEDGFPYVSMELLRNALPITLAAHKQSFEYKTHLLVQLLQALLYLHRCGVLHRDLKPRNVLVVPAADNRLRPEVKVLDFGLASLHKQRQQPLTVGTPVYMAPELWEEKGASQASDLYAFGVLCYEVYAGRRPYDVAPLSALYHKMCHEVPDLDSLDIPEHLRYMIAWLLTKDPADRYADAGEILNILQNGVSYSLNTETRETRESMLQAARFVGRDAEMRLLTRQLKAAMRGRGSALLVGGESGVGKTRLLNELWRVALVQRADVIRGHALREGGTPYAVWHESLRWMCMKMLPLPDEASVLRTVLPAHDLLPGADITPAPALPPKAEQLRLLLTVESALRRLNKPLVILLEDLHWENEESFELLHYLSGIVNRLPVLIVASFRDDEQPDLPKRLPDMQPMKLNRLTPAETAELVEAMLGPAGRDPVLLAKLQADTEGNAFFLVETLRTLAEEAGRLERIGSGPIPNLILTGGMNGVIKRRLQMVPAHASLFLQVAAVVGRELDLAVLREALKACRVTEPLDALLQACAKVAVLGCTDGQWHFTHTKLRDGVLLGMSAEQTRRLHQRVAEAIETVYQLRMQETAAALTHHWRQVGDAGREQYYAEKAGEQAMRHAGYQSAVGFLERAVALIDQVPMQARQQVTMVTRLGDALFALGRHAAARDRYEQSLALAESGGYIWGVAANLNNLGNTALQMGFRPLAQRYFEQALAKASQVRAKQLMLAALSGLAVLLGEAGAAVVATEYAALISNHPAADDTSHHTSLRLLERMQLRLLPDAYSSAVERGQTLSLHDVTVHILAS
jgi:hypothetical protein